MDLKKADFFTVIQFGTKEDFIQKSKIESVNLTDVINLKDKNGVSLLEQCFISRKYDIAQLLMENSVEINVISKENCNELHYLSANMEGVRSIDLATQLVELGVDLNLQDKRYKNTPFWYLCEAALLKKNQDMSRDMNQLIKLCMDKGAILTLHNIAGNTVESMLLKRASQELKKIVFWKDEEE